MRVSLSQHSRNISSAGCVTSVLFTRPALHSVILLRASAALPCTAACCPLGPYIALLCAGDQSTKRSMGAQMGRGCWRAGKGGRRRCWRVISPRVSPRWRDDSTGCALRLSAPNACVNVSRLDRQQNERDAPHEPAALSNRVRCIVQATKVQETINHARSAAHWRRDRVETFQPRNSSHSNCRNVAAWNSCHKRPPLGRHLLSAAEAWRRTNTFAAPPGSQRQTAAVLPSPSRLNAVSTPLSRAVP